MTDVHSPQIRSKNMAAIGSRDTQPEILIRKELFALGFRYRLNVKSLPGSPDLVFARYHAVIFIHGCFWHMHNCKLFKLPATRREFWQTKLTHNVKRDQKAIQELRKMGWRVAIVWECSIKGTQKIGYKQAAKELREWLRSDNDHLEITGDL